MSPPLGVVDLSGRSGGFLRRREANYLPLRQDVRVEDRIIRQFGLRTGDEIEGEVRNGRGGSMLDRLTTINGLPPEQIRERPDFQKLTAIHPDQPLRLECELIRQGQTDHTTRVIDLICPFGKGQRALIVAPAKAGKTMVLQAIAEGVSRNYPAASLFILLVDERPEEVFEMEAAGVGEVIASTFDHPAAQHVAAAELLLERARRRVELGQDVVLIVDSITRLARAYNAVQKGSGRTLSGGVDAQSLERPKRFFGSARQVDPRQGGGSLTIIATALVDTGSRMDQLIFEEFKGTGNAELHLDRKLADKRIYPAIDMQRSGTRKEDLLLTPLELNRMWVIRKVLAPLNPVDAMEFLLDRMKRTKDNIEFLESMSE